MTKADRKAKPTLLTPIRLHSIEVDKNNRQIVYWLYQCKCGRQTVVRRKDYKSHNTWSCGCLSKKAGLINLAKGRKKAKRFEKGHKINLGRKHPNRKQAPNKGKFAIYEIPNNKSSRKRFIDDIELGDIVLGAKPDGFT